MSVLEAREIDRLGPFHGRWEGYAKLSLALSFFACCVGILGLAFYFHIEAKIHSQLHTMMTAVAVGSIVLMILISTWQCITIFKKLGAQVAKGDAGAEALDKIRLMVSQTICNLLLVIVLVTFQLISVAVSKR